MDSNNFIFSAMIIPGKVERDILHFSIGLELNTGHDVFNTDMPIDPTNWKKDILFFPKVLRAAMVAQAFTLNCGDPKNPIPFTVTNPDNDANAFTLWSGMLGYEFSGGVVPKVREKAWKGPRGPIQVGGLKRLKKHLKTFSGHPSLGAANYAAQQVLNPIRSVKDIFDQINANDILNGLKVTTLDHDVFKGIDRAHQATLVAEQQRHDQVSQFSLLLDHKEHPVLVSEKNKKPNAKLTPKERKDRDDQLDNLLLFYRKAQTVINERDYIQEAIDKLNQTVSIRRFLGTIVDCQIPLKAVKGKTQFSLSLDTDKWNNGLKKNNLTLNYPVYFLGNTVTNASITDAGMQPALIATDPGHSVNTVLRLANHCKIISWETESVRNNMKNATQSLNENSQVNSLSLNADQINLLNAALPDDLATLLTLQSAQISTALLIKAAIKFNNHISNIQTKGHQLYITDQGWLDFDPNANRADNDANLYEHDLVGGYLVYLNIAGDKSIYCLNEVSEYFGRYTKNPNTQKISLPVGTDGMVHTMVSPTTADPQPDLQGIHNGYQYGWDGTRVNSENPMRHQERVYKNENDRTLDLIADFTALSTKIAIETLVLNLYSRRWLISETFPYSRKIPTPPPLYLLSRSFLMDDLAIPNPQLKFTTVKKYRYAMVGQFHNGYSPIATNELKIDDYYSEFVDFRRSDHIKPLIVSLDKNIYNDENHKAIKPANLGETPIDFVIRGGEILNNFSCSRFILPPPIPHFYIYLWYDLKNADGFTRSRILDESQRLKWYKKSQREDEEGKSADSDEKAHAIYKGSYDYLPDPVVTGFVLRFYYDKDCTLAMTGNYKEVFCPYGENSFPNLPAWQIILEDNTLLKEVAIDQLFHKIHVPASPGQQFYAAVFPTFNKDFACFADSYLSGPDFQGKTSSGKGYFDLLKCGITILSFTYALQRPLFDPQITGVNLTKFKKGSSNKQPSTVDLSLSVHFEHLNLWNGITIPCVQPTGEMDIFMLWDDYTNTSFGIQKSINQKINPKVDDDGYIYVGKVVFNQNKNMGSIYHSNMKRKQDFAIGTENSAAYEGILSIEVDHTFNINYFTDAAFRVKNVTKFARYFEDIELSKLYEANKEKFSRWSPKYSDQGYDVLTYDNTNPTQVLAKSNYLFNNVKPDSPKIEKIIPLIVKDDYKSGKVIYYQRLRIYFNEVPLTGKDGRIGLIVNEANSIYKTFLAGSISNAGIDVVTDDLKDRLNLTNDFLTSGNFKIDDPILDPDYAITFKPNYDIPAQPAINDQIGLVSYIVQFDKEQSLWYIDIQLDLGNGKKEEFHNPFVQLYLTAYQPYSSNYSNLAGVVKDSSDGFSLDYRVSAPVKAEFFSIYPSRTFENPFILFKHHPKSYCTLSGFTKSLFFKQSDNSLHTEFVVSVERKGVNGLWTTIEIEDIETKLRIDNVLKKNGQPMSNKFYQPLLLAFAKDLKSGSIFQCDFQLKFHKSLFEAYRIIVHEVDLFNGLDIESLAQILNKTDENQYQRTAPINISGVQIRGTYIFY